MAQEAKRACGYRKRGGLYLCSSGLGSPCCKMPIFLDICPTCNGGIKQSRGFQWIDPKPFMPPGECTQRNKLCPCARPEMFGDRVGLIWIGTQFYPRPTDFMAEVHRMGMSRRIQAVPRGFKIGETWVFLAHPRIREVTDATDDTKTEWRGGIFHICRPDRIEKIITETDAADEAEMAKLAKVGITPVVVPDDDRDHQGSVHDDDVGADVQTELSV